MPICLATRLDADKIAETHKAAIEVSCSGSYGATEIDAWTSLIVPEVYANAMEEKVMVVAQEGEGLLGLGILDPKQGEICAVYVHPRAQGRGIGRAILNDLERRALNQGADGLSLCATLNALDFYRHHGYVEQGSQLNISRCRTRVC